MRGMALLSVVAVLGCKKQPKEDAKDDPPTGPAKVGNSVTKLHEGSGDDVEDHHGSGGHMTHLPDQPKTGSDEAPVKKGPPEPGGNGQAAYRDDSGRVHGPGGPIFMGHGVDCDASHDHCMRKAVWFSVGNIVEGKLYRAVPVFLLEGKWWNFRGDEDDTIKLYMTKVAGTATLSSGTPIIWFSDETDSKKFAESEYEALTSSRWEAGVVDTATSNGKVRVKGWNDAVPMDTVRVITEVKDPAPPK